MEGITLIKGGTLDDGAADVPIQVEFYTKDRCSFTTPVDGAEQKQTMT